MRSREETLSSKTNTQLITTMKPAILLLALTSIALGQGSLTPPGPPGPIMRTLDEIEPRIPLNQNNTPGDATCVFKINKPGSYMLTGNLTPPAGKHGILIGLLLPGAVEVDMKGCTMDGSDAGAGASGVLVEHVDTWDSWVDVHNGTISNFAGSSCLNSSPTSGTLELSDLRFQGGCQNKNIMWSSRLLMNDVSFSGGSCAPIQMGSNSVLSGVEITGSGTVTAPLISGGDRCALEGVSLSWSFGASNPASAVLLGPGSRVSGMTARLTGGTFSGPVFANSSGFSQVSGLKIELEFVTAPSAYLGWAMLGDTGTHESGGSLARDAASGLCSAWATFPSEVMARNCTFTTAVGIISTACPTASYAPTLRIEGTTTAPAVLRVENSHCTIAADITLATTSNITGGIIRVYGAANTISSTIRGMVGGSTPGIEILSEQGTAVIGSQLNGRRDSAVTGIRIAPGATNVLVANNRATGFAAGSALVNNLGGSTNATAPIVTTPAQIAGNTNPFANIVH